MRDKLFLWGAGHLGQRVARHFDEDWDIVFVESNSNSIGTLVEGRKVISVEEYIKKYSNEFIMITHLNEEQAIEILKENKISNYLLCYELPAEFQEPNTRTYLKDYILSYLNERKDYVLYGLNIYSVVISKWIKRNFGISPFILLQGGVEKEYIECMQKHYPSIRVIREEKLSKIDITEICNCIDKDIRAEEYDKLSSYIVTDLYDCSDKIIEYYNPQIEYFHNIHSGKRCFIVANGPSLRVEDLDKLYENKEYCFGMNCIYYIFDNTKWRPTYYVMDDENGLRNDNGEVDKLGGIVSFLGDTSSIFWAKKHREDIYKYHKCYNYKNELPKFSEDCSRKIYTGVTVTYSCMQLAAYLGFTEIYLLGVDFSYANTGGVYKHFYGETKAESIGFHKYVANAYKAAKQYTDTHGIKIYNATRGGKLEIFDRVDFDKLF